MTVKFYSLSGDRMFPHTEGRWVHRESYDAIAERLRKADEDTGDVYAENAALQARLAEAEREQDTLLAMIRHQQDVLRECLPYLNESMAGRRPGRSADDIRAAVKALTTDSAPAGREECEHGHYPAYCPQCGVAATVDSGR